LGDGYDYCTYRAVPKLALDAASVDPSSTSTVDDAVGGGAMPPPMPWMMPSAPGSMAYPYPTWPAAPPTDAAAGRTRNTDSAAHAACKEKRKLNDDRVAERGSVSQKQRQIMIQPEEKLMEPALVRMVGMTWSGN
jgi:hypothetical protein